MGHDKKAISALTLAEAVENHLRQELLEGRWVDRIPSTRVIASDLGVSASTVSAALSRLKQAGLVTSAASRSRLRPSTGPRRKHESNETSKQILFLTHTPLHSASPVVNDVYRELVKRLPDSSFLHRDCPYPGREKVPKKLKLMIREENPDFLIVVSGTPGIASWAEGCGIPVIFFGGDPGDSKIPIVSVSSEEMLRKALECLIQLGHREIVLPLCGRIDAMCGSLRMIFDEIFKAHSIPYSEGYSTPFIERRDPSELNAALMKVWTARPASALILFSWNEFVAASCFLRKKGLSIPQDVSVIVFEDHGSHRWHDPVITHFKYPTEPAVQALLKWLRSWKRTGSSRISLEVAWGDGDSIAAR